MKRLLERVGTILFVYGVSPSKAKYLMKVIGVDRNAKGLTAIGRKRAREDDVFLKRMLSIGSKKHIEFTYSIKEIDSPEEGSV